jgi:tetratricopeptide (TPR) repeat protein
MATIAPNSRAWAQALPIAIVATLWIVQDVSFSLLLCLALLFTLVDFYFFSSRPRSLSPLDMAVLFFLLTSVVSTLLALYKPAAVSQLILRVTVSLVYFAVRALSDRKHLLATLLVFAATCYSLDALVHFCRFYRQWTTLGFSRLVDFRAYAALTSATVSPNADGIFLVFATLFLSEFFRSKPKARGHVLLLIPILLAFCCIALSFSRGLYLSLLVATIVFCCSLSRWRVRTAVICSVCILSLSVFLLRTNPIAAAILDTVRARATASQSLSVRGRKELILSGLLLFRHAPWFGVGPDNFTLGMQAFSLEHGPGTAPQPFNMFVSIAAEQGLVGFISAVLGCLAVAWVFLHTRGGRDKLANAALRAGGIALLLYLMVESFVFATPAVAVSFYILLAVFEETERESIESVSKLNWFSLSQVCVMTLAVALVPFAASIDHNRTEIEQVQSPDPKVRASACSAARSDLLPDEYIKFALDTACHSTNKPILSELNARVVLPALSRGREPGIASAISHLEADLNYSNNVDDGALSNLAWLFALSDNHERALELANAAISRYQFNFTTYVLVGALEEAGERANEAKANYARAVELYPRLIESQFWRDLTERNNQLAVAALNDATESERESLAAAFNPSTAMSLARLSYATHDNDRAQELTTQVTKILPNLSGTWELEGQLLADTNESGAILAFRKAAFLDPYDPLPHERMALLLLRRGAIDEAADQCLEAQKLQRNFGTPHSRRAFFQYHLRQVLRNDLTPPSLLRYLSPAFSARSCLLVVSDRYGDKGRKAESAKYLQLANEYPE